MLGALARAYARQNSFGLYAYVFGFIGTIESVGATYPGLPVPRP